MEKFKAHILVVDDDERIRELVKQYLNDNEYLVTTANNAEDAKEKVDIIKFDIIILDIMMPGQSGLDFTNENKKKINTPIILLTAKGEASERIEGLETGADDYLTKPFHEAELLARLKALLRRRSGSVSQILTVNGVSLDEAGQSVCTESLPWRSLTATEYRLLRYLMHHPDRVHSKDHLLDQLYALEQDAAESNLVEVYIARLRRYLGKELIQTRRGQGYLFVSH